jgi:hypothetical protein
MESKDILLYETGSGGDFNLELGDQLYQQFYLALFGGNVKESTKSSYLANEERFDYWGNTLIWKESKAKQFNSETERTLQEVALNSQGRLKILQAVKNDLAYLQNVINFEVQVSLLSVNRVGIFITFVGKTNQQDKTLQFVFDSSKNEVIIEQYI